MESTWKLQIGIEPASVAHFTLLVDARYYRPIRTEVLLYVNLSRMTWDPKSNGCIYLICIKLLLCPHNPNGVPYGVMRRKNRCSTSVCSKVQKTTWAFYVP